MVANGGCDPSWLSPGLSDIVLRAILITAIHGMFAPWCLDKEIYLK